MAGDSEVSVSMDMPRVFQHFRSSSSRQEALICLLNDTLGGVAPGPLKKI